MRKCVCPNCNANLTFSDDRDVAFCQYCGAQIMLDDYRSTRRIINDARVKEAETEQFKAETDRILKMQKIHREEQIYQNQAMEEKQYNQNRKIMLRLWIVASVFLTSFVFAGIILNSVAGVLIAVVSIIAFACISVFVFKNIMRVRFNSESSNADDTNTSFEGRHGLSIPKWLFPIEKQNFEAVEKVLRSTGFSNIECINLHDLEWSNFANNRDKVNHVQSIRINGKSIQKSGKIYSEDAKISILHHGWNT